MGARDGDRSHGRTPERCHHESRELGEHNICVNTLSPGGVFAGQPEQFVQNYNKRVPMGRLANGEDLQGAAVFLASDASAYITGQNIAVDGGWTAI